MEEAHVRCTCGEFMFILFLDLAVLVGEDVWIDRRCSIDVYLSQIVLAEYVEKIELPQQVLILLLQAVVAGSEELHADVFLFESGTRYSRVLIWMRVGASRNDGGAWVDLRWLARFLRRADI